MFRKFEMSQQSLKNFSLELWVHFNSNCNKQKNLRTLVAFYKFTQLKFFLSTSHPHAYCFYSQRNIYTNWKQFFNQLKVEVITELTQKSLTGNKAGNFSKWKLKWQTQKIFENGAIKSIINQINFSVQKWLNSCEGRNVAFARLSFEHVEPWLWYVQNFSED